MRATYTNPLGYADGVMRTDPDPFVMRFRGRYYCYSTDVDQVNVSVSDDMVMWHRLEGALRADGRSHFWAPCVTYHDGTFYMYVSNRPAGSDDPHEEVLQLATSANPEGPFEIVHRFFDTFSIDPHVVPDGSGGWVMFYSTNDVTGLDDAYTGTSIVAERMPAFDRLEGSPRAIVKPTLDQEIFERDRFGDGRDWYTIEGAAYFTRGNRAYLTYSGNAYEREDYFIGYSSAPLTGAPHELEWTKHPDDHTWSPLVRRSSEVEGTGHNSIVRAPNLVDDWIVYHGRDAADHLIPGVEQRVMRIDPLRYMGDELVTDAPTASPQAAPPAPTVFERFDGEVIDEAWQSTGDGTFSPSSDGITSGEGGRAVLVHGHSTDAYVAEVWFAADRNDRGARVGVIAAWVDDQNYTEVLVDAASSTLTVRAWSGGIGTDLACVASVSPAASVWHRLSITRTLGRASVALDDLAPIDFAVPLEPARVGVTTVRTRARFAAFSLTDHLVLEGTDLGALGSPFTCAPPLPAGERGIATPGSSSAQIDGARPADAATAYTVDLLTPSGSIVVVPWAAGEGSEVRIELDRTHVTAVVLSAGEIIDSVTHPRDGRAAATVRFAPAGEHALLHVDAWSHRLPLPASNSPRQRITLTGSRFCSYEQTDIAPHPHHPLAKEHA